MAVGTKSPQNPASSVSGPPSPGDNPVVGIEVDYARSDHSHGLPVLTGGSGAPSPTVTGPAAFGSSPVVGVSGNYSRGDHSHGNPSESFIPAASASVAGPPNYGDAKVVGVATTYSRGDHSHGLPNGSGSPATTVTGPDAYGAPAVVGVSGLFARGDHDHGLPAAFDPTTINSRLTTLEAEVATLMGGGGGSGVVAQFPGSYGNSMGGFLTALTDMSIDTLEIAAGTYSGWHDMALNTNRASRPLLVRPHAGAAVIWDGNASSGDGLLYPGWSSLCAYYTFDPAGTGGSFTIQNFSIGQTGIISTAYCDHFTMNGFIGINNVAPSTNGWTAYHVYMSSDSTHRGSNLTFNNWVVTSGDGIINMFQCEHSPQSDGITLLNNTFHAAGARFGFVSRLGATGVLMDGWHIDHAISPLDNTTCTGIVRNNVTTASTNAPAFGTYTDGGGNLWA